MPLARRGNPATEIGAAVEAVRRVRVDAARARRPVGGKGRGGSGAGTRLPQEPIDARARPRGRLPCPRRRPPPGADLWVVAACARCFPATVAAPIHTRCVQQGGGGDTRPPHGGVDPPGTGRSRKRRRATAAPNPAPSARPASKAWPASRSLPLRFHQSPRPGQHAVPASPVGRARHHTASQGAGSAGGGGVRGESGGSPREVQRCLLAVPAACLTAAAPEWSEREDGTRRRLGRARRQLLDECTFHCA